jgi:uncharacterized membrane protein
MSAEERLDRLEQRLEVLETLMRDVLRARGAPAPSASGAATEPPAPAAAVAPEPRQTAPPPAAVPRPGPIAPPSPAPRPAHRRAPSGLPAEAWIGQRGLLAVGVLALLLAAGYLLKLSFERGWITEAGRCIGGVLAGAAVGALGWRLLGKYRTYGAALIGCGAGIVYLAVWAAAKLYGLVPPPIGIAGLALVSIALAAIAYGIGVQALGTTAALGAFVAPVLLGQRPANADALLIYLGAMALALGWVAARKRWRVTTAVVALGFFTLGWSGAGDSRHPLGALLYAVAGGTGGIYLGLRETWLETRFLAFWGGWALVATVSPKLDPRWPTFLAGALLAAPVWWQALRRPVWQPLRLFGKAPEGWSLGEALYFVATPWLLGWAVRTLAPDTFAAHPGLDAFAVAVPYLAVGYSGLRAPFAFVGATAAAVAVLTRWPGVEAPAVLLGLSVLWAALDHPFGRSDGRWYALGTAAAALVRLFGDNQARRGFDDAAFTGPWALVLWLAVGVTVLLAARLWRREPATPASRLVPAGLWLLAGLLALFGVTGEIRRFFRLREASVETAQLASGLAVSAWWLVFAGVLVTVGLRRGIRPARLGGLAVAGLAVLKVLIFDLSSLDALYRVGSVFILGLVSLLLAYLYHRQARGTAGGRSPA